ncbi:MAG: hypothetical protein HY644_02500 [Acidobacteria bacterium]|nr:hypothetical protein [Acidobacteriota bacterium]
MKTSKLCLLIFLLLTPYVSALQNSQRELGKPQTKEEYDAYVAITQTTDAGQRAELSEKFISYFPDSGLAPYVHQIAATTYQQLNNFDKLAEHGEAALKDLPDSPVILTILANGYAERGQPDLALERSQRALASLNALQPPAQMDSAQFTKEKNNLVATVYSSMGVAYLAKATDAREKSPSDSNQFLAAVVDNFKKATELNPLDDYSYFRLGIAYTLQTNPEKAIEAYVTAVAIGGAATQMAADNALNIIELTGVSNSEDRLQELAEEKVAALEKASGACTGDGQQYLDCILSRKGSSAAASSGRVNVKGYYRKDGTYVRPHTRSRPQR